MTHLTSISAFGQISASGSSRVFHVCGIRLTPKNLPFDG
jgi:hypothetical protein